MKLLGILLLHANLVVVKLTSLDSCPIKIEPIGCYEDNVDARVFPELITNERNADSKAHNNHLIDWRNYHTYLPAFICRCAMKAQAKGYKMIGAQFYGECWSGPSAHEDIKKTKLTDTCVDKEFYNIREKHSEKCPIFVGAHATNYVYKIAPTDCDIAYKPLGCFHDDQVKPRPIPNYTFNERDFSIPNWNRKLIEWENWEQYSPQLVCRCAQKAKKKGHNKFAIQFWGECWSGTTSQVNYQRSGRSSNCRDEKFQPCKCNSYTCVGKAYTNYVYELASV